MNYDLPVTVDIVERAFRYLNGEREELVEEIFDDLEMFHIFEMISDTVYDGLSTVLSPFLDNPDKDN